MIFNFTAGDVADLDLGEPPSLEVQQAMLDEIARLMAGGISEAEAVRLVMTNNSPTKSGH
jgi:uncharacterized protein YoaH (UPF0181 family)